MKKAKPLTTPRLIVAGAGQCADLFYGSGFAPVDPVVFLDEGFRRTLVVPTLEYGRAQTEAKGVDVVLPENLDIPKEKRRSARSWALGLLHHRAITKVEIPGYFPAEIARLLEVSGIMVEIREGAIYPERAVKRPDEIKKIFHAQQAAVAAMRAAFRMLKAAAVDRRGYLILEGKKLTSERVREVIDITLLKRNCSARDTIVASHAQAADPHHRGSGPLRAGETIVIDIFPQDKITGYWGDITRTFCKGRPSPALQRMYRTVLAAQKKGLAMIRPGISGAQVHTMISRYFEEQGYPTTVKDGVARGFFHGTGHGVGLDIHEAPSLGISPVKLRAGHVVTVEPGLYDPDIGGIRIEDTVVVEKHGARILCAYPKSWEV